jgi:hypothetical protein
MDGTRFDSSPERRLGTVERAFEIARAGGCEGMSDIVRKLKGERFDKVDEHLAGQSIRRDLRRAWEAGNLADPVAPAEPAREPRR